MNLMTETSEESANDMNEWSIFLSKYLNCYIHNMVYSELDLIQNHTMPNS